MARRQGCWGGEVTQSLQSAWRQVGGAGPRRWPAFPVTLPLPAQGAAGRDAGHSSDSGVLLSSWALCSGLLLSLGDARQSGAVRRHGRWTPGGRRGGLRRAVARTVSRGEGQSVGLGEATRAGSPEPWTTPRSRSPPRASASQLRVSGRDLPVRRRRDVRAGF